LVSNYTDQQLSYLIWLRFYDWVQSSNGPNINDEEILEDDAAVDDYVEQWKADQDKRQQEHDKPQSGGNSGSHRHVEIG